MCNNRQFSKLHKFVVFIVSS